MPQFDAKIMLVLESNKLNSHKEKQYFVSMIVIAFNLVMASTYATLKVHSRLKS